MQKLYRSHLVYTLQAGFTLTSDTRSAININSRSIPSVLCFSSVESNFHDKWCASDLISKCEKTVLKSLNAVRIDPISISRKHRFTCTKKELLCNDMHHLEWSDLLQPSKVWRSTMLAMIFVHKPWENMNFIIQNACHIIHFVDIAHQIASGCRWRHWKVNNKLRRFDWWKNHLHVLCDSSINKCCLLLRPVRCFTCV